MKEGQRGPRYVGKHREPIISPPRIMKKNQPCGLQAKPPQTERTARRSRLERTVRALGGVFAPTKDFDDERELVDRLIASETAPLTTHRAWLQRHGLAFAAPDTLSPAELPAELRRLILALAFARVFLSYTDHLSDSALYGRLWEDVLEADEPDLPRIEDEAFHWDLSQGGTGDPAVWLTYYASVDDRDNWAAEFPDEPLPVQQPCPFDRDKDLPQPYATSEPL